MSHSVQLKQDLSAFKNTQKLVIYLDVLSFLGSDVFVRDTVTTLDR